ncbi:MAG: glycoside hydrolase family 3 N-terminal domain-containing protein [bacterium]
MMRRTRVLLATVLLLVTAVREANAQARAPYRDASLPIPDRVKDLLGRMTPDEKFWQMFMIPGDLDTPANDYSHGVFGLQISPAALTGADTSRGDAAAARTQATRVNAIQKYFVENTRLGIPIIPFEEAVHGIPRPGATMFPQAIALAATWDTALMTRVAGAIAREARHRGIRQVLAPVINIANDVRWGRVEETYGEDPVMSSLMGDAFIAAFERAGIVATPKHFVANVGDGGRDSYPIDVDQRQLRELYFPPFKSAVVSAHARSVMTSYNSVDGTPATQNRMLITDVLKREWGFAGYVISDAAATGGATVLHDTEASTATATKHALDAGLDVIFQSSFEQHRPYLAAFRNGTIADSVIDAGVTRVLRAKFELGLFEHPYVNSDSAAYWNGNATHRSLALESARASIVLLQNDRHVLPLSRSVRSVAVIGEDAMQSRLGGYSGPGNAPVAIYPAIRDRLSRATVRYAAGPGRVTRDYETIPPEQFTSIVSGQSKAGLQGEYFDNNALTGTPKVVRTDARIDFGWTLNSPARGIPFDWYSVRWTGRLTAPLGKSGPHRIGVAGNDGFRLYLDDKLVIDNWKKQSVRTLFTDVALKPGSTHDVKLEYFESTGNARIKLVWDAGVPNDWSAKIDSAVNVARRSDVAIVVVGSEEGEFRDRSSLALPGHQEELIQRVAATGKPVVVVLIGGSAITMSRWLDRVGAVIDAWYPGEEGGHAVTDVLFGDYSPAGRLPITFPMAEGQLPLTYNHKPTGRGDDYLDLTGQALFPFGHGLSYTTFEYSALVIEPAVITPSGKAVVRCRVKNTGGRAGDEVVQLYLRDVLGSVARPVMQLEGFRRIHLAPGEEREVTFDLSRDQLQMLDADLRWIVEPGVFRVMVGASSKDIRLRGELVVK